MDIKLRWNLWNRIRKCILLTERTNPLNKRYVTLREVLCHVKWHLMAVHRPKNWVSFFCIGAVKGSIFWGSARDVGTMNFGKLTSS